MANKRKNSGNKIRSTRGHDETKTKRYRQVTTNIPIDRAGNPIARKEQLPPSQVNAMSKAFSSIEEQCKPPSVAIKESPKPVKEKAKVLKFKPKVQKKQNPVQAPYQHKATAASNDTISANDQGSIAAKHGVIEDKEISCSLNNIEQDIATTDKLVKEKSFLFKMAYQATVGKIYVPQGELVARQQQRLGVLSSHEHDLPKLKQRKVDKAKRALILEHNQMLKDYPEETKAFFNGSTGVSKFTPNYEPRPLYMDWNNKVVGDVVQTTSSTVGQEGLFKPTDTVTKTPKVFIDWYANNVKPDDWPPELANRIQVYLTNTQGVLVSGEQYRRNVLIKSFEQQIRALKYENMQLQADNDTQRDEINFLMWEVEVNRNDEHEDIEQYATPMSGKKPTPALPTLRNQLKTYLTLHRSDPVKSFLRLNGYNANDSSKLKTYMAMRRDQQTKATLEVKSLRRLGGNIRCSLDNKRKEKYASYLHQLGKRSDQLIAARNVCSLNNNISVIRKWGNKSNTVNKTYSHTSRRVNNQYVAWWKEELRLRDEPTQAEQLEKLLEKPLNRAAHKVVKGWNKVNKVLTKEVNPFNIRKQNKLKEHKASVKAARKVRNAQKAVVKSQLRTEQEYKAHVRTMMRLIH